jgi:hypothetical protein
MALITLSEQPSSSVTGFNNSVMFQQTTATPSVSPIFSSVDRVANNIAINRTFDINNLNPNNPVQSNSSTPGVLTGRRPIFGLLFPRGYFNR